MNEESIMKENNDINESLKKKSEQVNKKTNLNKSIEIHVDKHIVLG